MEEVTFYMVKSPNPRFYRTPVEGSVEVSLDDIEYEDYKYQGYIFFLNPDGSEDRIGWELYNTWKAQGLKAFVDLLKAREELHKLIPRYADTK